MFTSFARFVGGGKYSVLLVLHLGRALRALFYYFKKSIMKDTDTSTYVD